MKKVSVLLLSCLFFAFSSCGKIDTKVSTNNYKYIEAISPKVIGRLSPIAFSLVSEPKVASKVSDYISMTPPVKGKWEIEGRNAIFTPEEPYKADSKVSLKVKSGYLMGSDDVNETFSHDFLVSAPEYALALEEIRFDEKTSEYILKGNVKTDIPYSEKEIEKTLTARFGGSKQNISWNNTENETVWSFSIENIKPSDKDKKVSLSWNCKELGVTRAQNKVLSGSKDILIPAYSDFSIIDVNTDKPNTILVSFSKPLDASQDVASFVRTENIDGKLSNEFNANVRGNVLTIFNDSDWENIKTVALEKGIKSNDGNVLLVGTSLAVADKWEKPDFKFKNENVILPTTQGAVLAIETRNLTGVLIQVYDIGKKNINQFLQVNELNGTYEMYRVGEPVWEKKVSFDWDDSMQNKYISRGLDLSELVKKYPSGMFHIRISFRKDQIKYNCRENHGDYSRLPMPPDTIQEYSVPSEKSSWDSWEKNSDYDNYWYYRNDPCHPAFYLPSYNSSNLKSQNIIVSDLGIMAKRDNEGKLYVTVANLKTAEPIPGAKVQIQNFVGSVLKTSKTNENGTALFKDSSKAFIVTATVDDQVSFLKLSAGTALSVSHFEIGGEKSSNGVKGFIYGERGVWRPGNTMYFTFVLQDLEKTLPETIPVLFELKDPMGRVVASRTLTESVNGFYPIQVETLEDAPTGLWTANVTVGGKTWTKNVSVEVVVPNKLSVELTSNKEYLETRNNVFELKGAWLHGAPTPQYKADVSVSYSEADTVFDGYEEYTFTNPQNHIEYSRESVWNGYLNAASTAFFTANLDAGRKLPGKLKANFVSRIHEPSGGFSMQSKSFDYSPYSSYVGIKLPKGDETRNMLLTDVNHTVDVAFLDAGGQGVSGRLDYTVYKMEWKWWWEKDAYTSATHVSSSYYNKVASGSVNVKDGKGSFNFVVKYPDWGRYLVEVRDGNYGHSAAKVVYIDWPGWAGRAQEDGSGSASMVPLTAGKQQYTVGEKAQISFTSNSEARALVTVEKAGKIIKQQWIQTVTGTNVYELPVTAAMAPNVYVHLTMLQPHLQTANSLPIRLYGLIPINVNNPKTKLNPLITVKNKFEPNKKASITVSEKNGRPMTYTLAVVDEGLLGLTNYHSPDLRNEFYKKEASELESWDLYKYVINAYSGKLETILSIGGSEGLLDNAARDQNRFTPVVKYFGPFTLEAGEKKTTTFEMPHYIGAVRAMVIAGDNGAYGVAEKTITVKSDIMVQASIPRTLGCNEFIVVPVAVFNGFAEEKKISVTLSAKGAINSTKTQEILVGGNQNVVIEFPVVTTDAGSVVIETVAKCDSASMKSTENVEVKSRGVPVTYKSSFVLNGVNTSLITVSSPEDKSTTNLTVDLSSYPQIDLTSRLSYLTEYPHGCIEQITSGGFPQLYIPDYIKLSPEETNRIKENVMSVFERYSTYQTSSGAFGYWPGNQSAHSWGTCYAVHFMLEAKKKGYSVPDSVLIPALNWLKNTTTNWTSNSSQNDAVQAYRLYVLTLAGIYDTASMNRLNSKELTKESLLFLAAAYANSGRKQNAVDLLKKYVTNISSYRYMDDNFSSGIRESAIYLHVCTLADYTSNTAMVSKTLTEILSSNSWLTTQEVAWSLNALLPYYSSFKYKDAAYEIINSDSTIKGKIEKVSVVENLVPDKKSNKQNVTVKNTGNSPLYGTLIASGMSVPGTEKEVDSKLKMTVSGLSENDLANLKTGDTIKIKVEIRNNSSTKMKNLALTIPIATGFEFTNERVGNQNYRDSSYTYRDIRDDAVYTYFDLDSWSQVTYTFNVTVAYSGNYYIPAIKAEAMYDNEIFAIKPGKVISAK